MGCIDDNQPRMQANRRVAPEGTADEAGLRLGFTVTNEPSPEELLARPADSR